MVPILDPLPWYIAGPIIGFMAPLLLWIGGKSFGVSANLRHLCAALLPARTGFFAYDWKRTGLWNLTFATGIMLGGVIAPGHAAEGFILRLNPHTTAYLEAAGLRTFTGLAPAQLFSPAALGSTAGLVCVAVGGLLVGFGARYAGGCTSGHAISGLATLQPASLAAVVGFFAGGLVVTHFLLPWLL